ncbi:MAG: aldo/keto reductase [Candidatus Izemoplasmataceae bacterium]
MKAMFVLDNQVKIPSIGFGTAPLKGEEAYNAVMLALSAKYLHIDTAQNYQNEDMVGKAIKDSNIDREKLFITSKLDASIKDYDQALNAFHETLKKLDLDYLDLYLIHAPWPWDDKFSNHDEGNIEAYKALMHLYQEGKVKAIGVSNFDVRDLTNLKEHGFTPHVNQIKFHIGHRQKEIVEYCKKESIQVEAYSPLGRSKVLNHPILIDMAKRYQVSVAQLCIRYVLQHEILPLPRSSTKQHIENNLLVDFVIKKEDMEVLDDLTIDSIEFGRKKE